MEPGPRMWYTFHRLHFYVGRPSFSFDRGAKKRLTTASGAACRQGSSELLREKSAELTVAPTPLESASVAYQCGPCVASSQCVGDRRGRESSIRSVGFVNGIGDGATQESDLPTSWASSTSPSVPGPDPALSVYAPPFMPWVVMGMPVIGCTHT